MSLKVPAGIRLGCGLYLEPAGTRSLTSPTKSCLIRGCGTMTTSFQHWHWRLWANGGCSMQDARTENGWRSVAVDGEHGGSIVLAMTNADNLGEIGARQIREQKLLSFSSPRMSLISPRSPSMS